LPTGFGAGKKRDCNHSTASRGFRGSILRRGAASHPLLAIWWRLTTKSRIGNAHAAFICGEVYLWGTVVEHKLGWRAQFAYPKSLVLPLSLLPFTLAELNTRLLALIAFGIDIFVLHNRQSIRLWKHGQGYGTEGLDYIISLRVEHCLRQQEERKLKKGDRVALLGRGIAVVQQVDHKAAVVVLGNRVSLKIARREIVLNKQNMRWECETKAQLLRS
jgi:preprotein translocase subunit YajC